MQLGEIMARLGKTQQGAGLESWLAGMFLAIGYR